MKKSHRFVTMAFITFVVRAFQSLLEGVFTLIEDFLVISVSNKNFYRGYTMVYLLHFTISVLFSIRSLYQRKNMDTFTKKQNVAYQAR